MIKGTLNLMASPSIIYEDKNFLAVNKPAGLVVHASGAKSARGEPTLVDWLLEKYPEIKNVGDPSTSSGQVIQNRPGIVHRLDKDTSGVMLVARNQKYFNYLKLLFQNREIHKKYLAVVWGVPKNNHGKIEKPIGLKSGTTKRSVHSKKMLKGAITEYRVIGSKDFGGIKFSLLEVIPETGRTHQIRVHLNSVGHPVLGDKLYGSKSSREAAPRLMLHALSLGFRTDYGKIIKVEAEPPAEFKVFFGGDLLQ